MSISSKILGSPTRDNCLYVKIDSGKRIDRLLFDCGEACLHDLGVAEIQQINHLFFSHLHMDHVSGFDSYFRCNFNRESRINHIWGPPETIEIMHHRFRGFIWNLHHEMNGDWMVHDIHNDRVQSCSFKLTDAFSKGYSEPSSAREGFIALDEEDYTVSAFTMDHRTPSMAYLVQEKSRLNVDKDELAKLGFEAGPWLNELKVSGNDEEVIKLGGKTYRTGDLKERLIRKTKGDSIAYLTDFLLENNTVEWLARQLNGVKTIVCEGQYSHNDLELARRHHHMTVNLAAALADLAGADELILFHLSDRYNHSERQDMLLQAREIFRNTQFPNHWE